MKLRRNPRLPRDLRKVQAALGKLNRRPVPQPDLAEAHAAIRSLVESMIDDRTDDEIAAEVDAYVDTLLAEWLAAARRRHRATSGQLDRLQVPVEQALVRTGTLDHDEERQLRDYEGAVESSIDQVVDPDTPYYDPLPRQLTKE